MAEEKKELWLKLLPATTVVFAVCATLSTSKGGGYSNKSLIYQAKASDQWNFYQAKSIKSYLCDMQKERLELDSHLQKDPAYLADINARIKSYDDKIKKFAADKDTITVKAKELEDLHDNSKLHSGVFGMGVVFLQISILLSSIAALVKKSPLWYLSLVAGIAGIVYFINGFYLFF